MVSVPRQEVIMVELWTLEAVADRFTEAARTARRLPRVAVQGYVSAWRFGLPP